ASFSAASDEFVALLASRSPCSWLFWVLAASRDDCVEASCELAVAASSLEQALSPSSVNAVTATPTCRKVRRRLELTQTDIPQPLAESARALTQVLIGTLAEGISRIWVRPRPSNSTGSAGGRHATLRPARVRRVHRGTARSRGRRPRARSGCAVRRAVRNTRYAGRSRRRRAADPRRCSERDRATSRRAPAVAA